MNMLKWQVHLSGPVSGLGLIFFFPISYGHVCQILFVCSFFRPNSFSFVFHFPSFCRFFKDSLHTVLRYAKFSFNGTLGITFFSSTMLFYACQNVYLILSKIGNRNMCVLAAGY